MKLRVIITALLFVLMAAGSAWAGPFLVCDPQTGVTNYDVVRNGLSTIVDARPDTRLGYDLEGLPIGTHNFEVSAIIITNEPGQGSWGQSDPVPFVGTRVQVNPVSGLSVSDVPF